MGVVHGEQRDAPSLRTRFLRLFDHPVGRVFNGAIGFMAIVTLVAFSPPGGYFLVLVLAIWAWVLAGVVWLARFIGVVLVRRTSRRRTSWLFAPIVVMVAIVAIQLDGPLLLRFRLSEPAMTQFAKRAVLPPASTPPQRIGLWEVGSVETFNGGVRFTVAGAGFIDDEGFAYSAQGPPQAQGSDSYRHLDGPWYLWHRRF